jgi:hypothetical protein
VHKIDVRRHLGHGVLRVQPRLEAEERGGLLLGRSTRTAATLAFVQVNQSCAVTDL